MRFSEDTREFYLGSLRRCYVGYSADQQNRYRFASGGIVNTILRYLLKTKMIDGALLSRIEIINGQITAKPFIATTPEEILSACGSIYFNINPLSDKELISHFNGRLAIVGLPCHLRQAGSIRPKNKIAFKIGLFCGHNSKKELLTCFLKHQRIQENDVRSFSFRRGHWRGNMELLLSNGEKRVLPFSRYSLYQNLHLFSLEKCLYCHDHTAETSDLSTGDIWLRKMKKKAIKHSIFISRSSKAESVLQKMAEKKDLIIRDSSPSEVFQAQKRSLIHHKNLFVRSKLSKLFGMKIPFKRKGKHQWNDYLSTLIVLFNVTISNKEWAKGLCFRIPRPVLFFYLLFFKLLTNF